MIVREHSDSRVEGGSRLLFHVLQEDGQLLDCGGSILSIDLLYVGRHISHVFQWLLGEVG